MVRRAQILSTAIELLGIVLVVSGLAMFDPRVALVALGLFIIVIGYASGAESET